MDVGAYELAKQEARLREVRRRQELNAEHAEEADRFQAGVQIYPRLYKMETTIVYWGHIGIMEKTMETTIVCSVLFGAQRTFLCFSPKSCS